MKKVVIHRAGSHEQLRIEEGPDLLAGAGEVLIEVSAIGVNYADCIVRMGLYRTARLLGWPITPGFEVSGRVAGLGSGVTDLSVGDEVFAVLLFNAYASQVVAPRSQVYRRPTNLTLEEAAAFPAVFLTAAYALLELGQGRSGQRILVHSAAGGVGSALVQIGKVIGCHVTGVVGGAHKVEVARSFGADVVIDKSHEPLWPTAERAAPKGFDIVLDANGVETLGASYQHLRAPGRLVIYGFHTMMPRQGGRPNYLKMALDYLRTPRFNPLTMTNENRSVMAFNLSTLFEEQELLARLMAQLLGWVEEGRLKSSPLTEFPMARVADAHRALESGRTVGKLLLRPS